MLCWLTSCPDRGPLKAANVRSVAPVHREKHPRRARQLLLFAIVDGQYRFDETRLAAASHFDEHEATFVEHDQVYLAMTATKIASHEMQPFVGQESKRKLLSVLAWGAMNALAAFVAYVSAKALGMAIWHRINIPFPIDGNTLRTLFTIAIGVTLSCAIAIFASFFASVSALFVRIILVGFSIGFLLLFLVSFGFQLPVETLTRTVLVSSIVCWCVLLYLFPRLARAERMLIRK